MMARPTSKPTWATDTNYTNGPSAGTPTKVTVPGAAAAEGWRPSQKPPAQYQNDWQNRVGAWVNYLDMKMRNWRRIATLVGFEADARAIAYSSTIAPNDTADPWVIAEAAVFKHSPSGEGYQNHIEEWENAAANPTFTGATRIVSVFSHPGSEHFLAFTSNGQLARSINGDTWTDITIDSESEPFYDAASAQGTPDIVVVLCRNVSADVDIFSSPDITNWTKRTVPTLAVKLTGVSWDGTRFIAVGNSKTARSTDGTTWALTTDPPANLYGIRSRPDTGVSLAYVLAGDTMYRTTDGISWTAITAPGGTGGTFEGGLHYADGIWVIARNLVAGQTTVPAWWSDDDGDTWHPIRIPRQVTGIAYGQGRWLLTCDNNTDTYIYASLSTDD